jgi:hypothetical protein
MQLVFEFGAKEPLPVVEAIRRVIESQPYAIECVPKGSDTTQPTADTLISATARLERGEISSLTVRTLQKGPIRYALVLSPFLFGEDRSFYLGTIEYLEGNYAPIWDLILGTAGLTVAALGYEEGVDFGDANLSEETFPWDRWPLVIGALRYPSGTGTWITREGPEIHRFNGSG